MGDLTLAEVANIHAGMAAWLVTRGNKITTESRYTMSKIIIPEMLKEIRLGNPEADITILIATGCHRGTTKQELVAKFGEDIVEHEKIYIHDCDEKEKLVNISRKTQDII